MLQISAAFERMTRIGFVVGDTIRLHSSIFFELLHPASLMSVPLAVDYISVSASPLIHPSRNGVPVVSSVMPAVIGITMIGKDGVMVKMLGIIKIPVHKIN